MNLETTTNIDFYVSVIDNYGDMGFALNLAFSLHEKYPKLTIRFFGDDENLFKKFLEKNNKNGIEYISLETLNQPNPPSPAKLIYNFFDRPLPKTYLSQFPYQKTIVSFSYFLLHTGLESLHKTTYILENGYDTIIHFIPSLLRGGGGIIINPEIELRKKEILKISKTQAREQFIKGENKEIYIKKWISIFVYENTLKNIAQKLSSIPKDTIFFIFGDDEKIIKEGENIIHMPFLSLEDYGIFQSLCDANIVRGENSLCQGLMSEKPVLWDIYKENNSAHKEKIEDYLLFLQKQFPETDWNKYIDIMRKFNEGDKEKIGAFLNFVSGYEMNGKVFGEISEYIKEECDLVGKLEEILKK